MRMTVGVGTAQSITPQMIAAMKVLQSGAQELKDYLEELSYENPLMDLQEPEQIVDAAKHSAFADKLKWLKSYDCQNNSYYTEPEQDSLDQFCHLEKGTSLVDFVKEQILTLDASPEERTAMEVIADLLDERGLYGGTLTEIAALAGCSTETAKTALRRVRMLDPAGVAAETIQTALLMQLCSMDIPCKGLVEELLEKHFQYLGSWSEKRLAKELGTTETDIQQAKKVLAGLNPFPSNGFASETETQYITPDLRIDLGERGCTVTAEDPYTPTIHINAEYLKLLSSAQDPKVKQYLKQKLEQLEQVMQNVDRRKSTMLRCGEIIADRQASFFSGGTLTRMTLRDVAEKLGVHESTVSRAVKNKYVQCDRGIYPMSHFFRRNVGQNYGMCRSGIQAVMEEIIRSENPANPLSDEKIVAELDARHISLSRRSVAKYRLELGIPPASARKHTV